MSNFQEFSNALQIDGEDTKQDFLNAVSENAIVISNQTNIATLQKQVREMREFLQLLTEGLVIKKTNENGEIEYITFNK